MRKKPFRSSYDFHQSADVALMLDISHRTLMRWLASGKIPEPSRNPANGYRYWRPAEVEELRVQVLAEKRGRR